MNVMVIADSKPSGVNITRILLAGAAATAAMTLFMIVIPFAGLPDMNMGKLLGTLFKDSAILGWTLHFVIGIFYAFLYALLFNRLLPVENHIARGALYGIVIFLLSEILLTLINLSGAMHWADKESWSLMVFGNALAHLIYGTVLGFFFTQSE